LGLLPLPVKKNSPSSKEANNESIGTARKRWRRAIVACKGFHRKNMKLLASRTCMCLDRYGVQGAAQYSIDQHVAILCNFRNTVQTRV